MSWGVRRVWWVFELLEYKGVVFSILRIPLVASIIVHRNNSSRPGYKSVLINQAA